MKFTPLLNLKLPESTDFVNIEDINSNTVKIEEVVTAHSADHGAHNQYATSSTATSTVAKVVTYTGFELNIGSRITVKFTNANTATNPTLNVNSTGAKPIYQNGVVAVAGAWSAGEVIEFIYDGMYWHILARHQNATTTKAGIVQLNDTTISTSTSEEATANIVKQVNDKVVKAQSAIIDTEILYWMGGV